MTVQAEVVATDPRDKVALVVGGTQIACYHRSAPTIARTYGRMKWRTP